MRRAGHAGSCSPACGARRDGTSCGAARDRGRLFRVFFFLFFLLFLLFFLLFSFLVPLCFSPSACHHFPPLLFPPPSLLLPLTLSFRVSFCSVFFLFSRFPFLPSSSSYFLLPWKGWKTPPGAAHIPPFHCSCCSGNCAGNFSGTFPGTRSGRMKLLENSSFEAINSQLTVETGDAHIIGRWEPGNSVPEKAPGIWEFCPGKTPGILGI